MSRRRVRDEYIKLHTSLTSTKGGGELSVMPFGRITPAETPYLATNGCDVDLIKLVDTKVQWI
jgi:hypothetical protein